MAGRAYKNKIPKSWVGKKVINELIKSGAVRPKDYHAFRYLRDNK